MATWAQAPRHSFLELLPEERTSRRQGSFTNPMTISSGNEGCAAQREVKATHNPPHVSLAAALRNFRTLACVP